MLLRADDAEQGGSVTAECDFVWSLGAGESPKDERFNDGGILRSN